MDEYLSHFFSLVKSLLDSGFLQKDNTSRFYELSPRLPLLGLKYLERVPTIQGLRDRVVTIANLFNETTVLAMQNGLYSQYIYVKRKAPQDDGKHVKLGSLRPMACAASGWAIMTQFSEIEIGKYIRATNLAISDKHWEHNLSIAKTEIELAKDRGYAFSKASEHSETAGIAVPILRLDSTSYAICVAGREQNLLKKEQAISEVLRELSSDVFT